MWPRAIGRRSVCDLLESLSARVTAVDVESLDSDDARVRFRVDEGEPSILVSIYIHGQFIRASERDMALSTWNAS